MNVEIHFSTKGNTIIGSHAAYLALDSAIENKSVPCPYGHCIKGSECEIKRLAEYVSLFGYCISSLAGWRKACELAGTELVCSDQRVQTRSETIHLPPSPKTTEVD